MNFKLRNAECRSSDLTLTSNKFFTNFGVSNSRV